MAARRVGTGGVLGAPLPAAGPDRRRSTRIETAIRATVREAELQESPPVRARLVDISDRGVCMDAQRRVPVGSRVVLDLECELPLRVHLGYDVDALVVDGPMHTHLVRVAGAVVRSERAGEHQWKTGVELCADTSRFDELQSMRFYVDHLREQHDTASF